MKQQRRRSELGMFISDLNKFFAELRPVVLNSGKNYPLAGVYVYACM